LPIRREAKLPIPLDPSTPLSPDIEDRRGKKPTLFDKAKAKVSELTQAVKDDYDDMKQTQADKANPQSMDQKIKHIGDIPSYKKGGKVRRTGLAFVHKGERVVPKSKVKRAARKRG
jgi:hypothetical protein